jgi:uncharacterized damage-inducible protein DinB
VKLIRCMPAIATFAVTLSLTAPAFAAQASPGEVFAKSLDSQEQQLIGIAEAMPADKYGFAPSSGKFDGVRTFGQQLTHIAEAQYFFFAAYGVKPPIDPKSLDKVTGKDEIIKSLKESFAFARKATETMTAQNAFEEIPQRDGTNTRASIAALSLAHTNDHYGQLVEYLRMNGIVPPGSK